MAENKDLEEYKISTMEDEEDYFDNVEMELDYSISITEGSMELGKDNIKEQKKYMRDSHGDMDDEEFLQNMQSVNNDEAFIRRAAKRLEVYEHQKKVPYFGKFVFKYKDDEEYLPVYVGMSGYQSDMNGQQLVYDWRAPVSSMYYAYEKGPASYNVHVDDMEDDEFSGDIVEKKQFLVSNGRLKDAVDTDSNINDAILLEALGGNSGVKMKNVVATIQKEQDASILARLAAVNFHVFVVLDAVGKHFTDRGLREAGCRATLFRDAQLPDIDDFALIAFLQDVNTPTASFRKAHNVVCLLCFRLIAEPNPQHLVFFRLGDFIRPDDYAFRVKRLRCYRKEVAVLGTDKGFCRFHDFVTVLHSNGDSVALHSPKVVGVCFVVGKNVGHFPPYRNGTEELCFQAVFPGNHASHVCRRGGNGDISVAFRLNRELTVFLNDFLICRSEGLIIEDGASFIEQNEGGSLSIFVCHCGGDGLVLKSFFRVPCLEELVSGIERRRLA